jgi:hypothetical protein
MLMEALWLAMTALVILPVAINNRRWAKRIYDSVTREEVIAVHSGSLALDEECAINERIWMNQNVTDVYDRWLVLEVIVIAACTIGAALSILL